MCFIIVVPLPFYSISSVSVFDFGIQQVYCSVPKCNFLCIYLFFMRLIEILKSAA